jgi:hypothetical protein
MSKVGFSGWLSAAHQRLAHLGNLTLVAEGGWEGQIMVVMCGPFMSKQTCKDNTTSRVDPHKIIADWVWMKENNCSTDMRQLKYQTLMTFCFSTL